MFIISMLANKRIKRKTILDFLVWGLTFDFANYVTTEENI